MNRKLKQIALLASIVFLTGTACVITALVRDWRYRRLETAMPLGIPASEADRIVGSKPDRADTVPLIASNNALFYTPDGADNNEPPKTLQFRTWHRGSLHIVVTVDPRNDRVVSCRVMRTANRGTSYFRWLGLPF